jgi:hypothetical protein
VAHISAISSEENQLIKIDPARREVAGRPTRLEITARIPLSNSPNTLGLDRDGVWVGLQMGQPKAGLVHVDAASNQVRIYPDRGWPAGRVGSEFWLYQHGGYDFVPLLAIDPSTGHTADRFMAFNIGDLPLQAMPFG